MDFCFSITLSFQIPNASGAAGVQLMGNVTTKDGTQAQPLKVAVTSGAGVAQLSSGGQSSGSLIAQQQVGSKTKQDFIRPWP